jgi:hypothetical protein
MNIQSHLQMSYYLPPWRRIMIAFLYYKRLPSNDTVVDVDRFMHYKNLRNTGETKGCHVYRETQSLVCFIITARS